MEGNVTGIVGATCISVHMHKCHKSRNRKCEQVVHRVKSSSDLLALNCYSTQCCRAQVSTVKFHSICCWQLWLRLYRYSSSLLRSSSEALPFASALSRLGNRQKKRPVTAPTERTAFSSRFWTYASLLAGSPPPCQGQDTHVRNRNKNSRYPIQVFDNWQRASIRLLTPSGTIPSMILLVLSAELGASNARAHIHSMHVPNFNLSALIPGLLTIRSSLSMLVLTCTTTSVLQSM